jgi:two-component system LytT family response regulator
MKITCFIVDDTIAGRERITSVIDTFFSDEIKVLGTASSPSVALDQIPKINPDICFLDVEMPGMTGLKLAEKLQEKGYKGKIIFITGHIHYSVKAIRANAFDYLIKPVDVDELKQCIERYKQSDIRGFDKRIIQSFQLSEREVELIEHLSKGLSSEEAASKMILSRHTVDTHRRNIHTKTGTRNVVELLNLLRNG